MLTRNGKHKLRWCRAYCVAAAPPQGGASSGRWATEARPHLGPSAARHTSCRPNIGRWSVN